MAFGILGWEALGLIVVLVGSAVAYGVLTRKHRVVADAARWQRRKARIRSL